jgi:hypothetical protein
MDLGDFDTPPGALSAEHLRKERRPSLSDVAGLMPPWVPEG